MEKCIMRYLKKFESNSSLFDEYVKDSWTPFTIEMFKRYCDIVSDENAEDMDIEFFFDALDNEYIDVESYDLYMVYYDNTEGMRDADFPDEVVYTSPIKVFSICEANGDYHASLKTALKYKDPEMILYLESKKISDEDIEEELKRIEEEKNIWTNIL
jgi:hypothetical protein